VKQRIELHKEHIEYTLKVSKRTRSMRLTIYPGGEFVVAVPQGMPESLIRQFLIRKSRWIIEKLAYFKTFSRVGLQKNSRQEYAKYKHAALALAKERIALFNKAYGYAFRGITIRNQKTRWGSCSRKGNLNFNYRIALLPPHLADYILLHELCHLGEFNHSRAFWNLMTRVIPDYRERRRELKRRGIGYI
jgi:predicted metal-dependent hydrolase